MTKIYQRKKYNVHGKFRFTMAGNFSDYALNEWRYYFDDNDDYLKTNLQVFVLDKRIPDPWKIGGTLPMEVVGMKAWISDNSIIFTNSHKFANWKAWVSYVQRTDQPPEIYFEPGIFGWWYLRENLIEPYMRYYLAEYADTFLIHAASMSINGKGVLLPAFGGVGKSMTILNMSTEPGHDIKFMSEDCALVTGDRKILGYPHVLRTFSFSTKPVGPFYDRISTLGKITIKMKELLHKIFFGFARLPYDFYDLNKMFNGRLEKEAPLKYVFFLRKTNQDYVSCNGGLSKDDMIHQMKEMIRMELFEHSNFDPYFMYSAFHPLPMVENYWENLDRGLRKIFDGVEIHEIYIPVKYDRKAYDDVKEYILKVVE